MYHLVKIEYIFIYVYFTSQYIILCYIIMWIVHHLKYYLGTSFTAGFEIQV